MAPGQAKSALTFSERLRRCSHVTRRGISMAALGPRCATAARHGRVTRSLSSPVCLGRHDGDTQRRRQLHASPPLLSSMRDPPLPPVVPGPGLRILDYFQPPPARRRSSSEEDKAKSARQLKYKDIAILGGGLTGLTTAFYLSRALAGVAGARITLYEANPERIGGWVRTDKVGGRESGRANETEEDGEDGVSAPTTRLELGPRTLRTQAGEAKWDDWVLFELVTLLGLEPYLYGITRKRFNSLQQAVLYPGTRPVPLPRPAALLNSSPIGVLRGLLTVLREPVFEGLLSAIWAFWKRGNAILGRVVRAEQEARAWAVRNDGDGSDGGGRGGGPLPLGEGMCVDFSASPDRSVGDEVRSLLGNGPAASKVVDNLVSAVVHGIYGGDVDALSAQACALTAGNRYFSAHRPLARGLALPLTNEPDENRASVAHGRARQNVPLLYVARKDLALARELRWTDAETGGRVTRLANALRAADMPILAFRGGMQTLTRRLEEELCAMGEERVRIIRGRRVTGLELVEGQDGEKVKVTFADDAVPPAYHDKVISTLYSDTLHRICPSGSLPSLSPASPSSPGAVTIGVAGLQSSDTSRDSVQLAPAEEGGFGYLIPRSARLDANPHMALGVLFDSNVTTLIDAEPVPLPPDLLDQAGPESGGEDNAVVHLARHFLEAQQRQEEALAADPKRGTRLTVMLGGHWWGDSRSSDISGESKDVADHLIEAAKQTVHLQLGIEPSSWTSAAAVLATACIPQPRVGHFGAMAALHAELLSAFHGRVAVAGPSYVGVGVLGCLRAGRDAAMAVARSTVGDGMYSGEEDVWVEAEKETVAHVGETGLAEFVPGKDGEAPEVSRPLVVAADRVFGKRGLKW